MLAPPRPDHKYRRPRKASKIRSLGNAIAIIACIALGAGFLFGPGLWHDYQRYRVTRPAYEAKNGLWTIVATSPVRSIHAVYEVTGNILLMAGTGNNGNLGGKVVSNLPLTDYKAAIFDPHTNAFTSLNALWDVFCGGHVILPNGNILVAGGTKKYEKVVGTNKTVSQFEGVTNSAIFNVHTNTWTTTGKLNHARWYPTIIRTGSPADTLIVSGLDQHGNIDNGNTEFFDPNNNTWVEGSPKTHKVFPTYPALFTTRWKDWLLWSGANAGYGPQSITTVRKPGLWNFVTGQFIPINGLPDPQDNETAGTVLLPPAQNQTVMFIGGGVPGDKPGVTDRTALVDLNAKDPKYVRGPNLDHPKRYPLVTVLPNDTVLIAGGSDGYRGSDPKTGAFETSDVLSAQIYNPRTNKMTEVAAPEVGRDYHSEAILTNTGAVYYFGSNPLSNTNFFEMRIEEYQPPYFFQGPRPQVTASPAKATLGGIITIHVKYNSASLIKDIRLIAPSAYTHVTDNSQRSVAAQIISQAGGVLKIRLPSNPNLLIPGYYMLFAVNSRGLPSVAPWIQINQAATK